MNCACIKRFTRKTADKPPFFAFFHHILNRIKPCGISSKKISSYIASYHLSTLMKKLGWKSNKEYRTTNKTYGRDYYTEKARVELFKKIDEDYESIVRLSNAHFVE